MTDPLRTPLESEVELINEKLDLIAGMIREGIDEIKEAISRLEMRISGVIEKRSEHRR